jgi:hypothetical protein
VFDFGVAALRWFFGGTRTDRHKKTLIKWIRRWFLLSYCHGLVPSLWSLNLLPATGMDWHKQKNILGIGKEEGCICIYIHI